MGISWRQQLPRGSLGYSALQQSLKCLKGCHSSQLLPTPHSLKGTLKEEMQRGKRRRIYSLEPNAAVCAGFPHRYASHLLPALTKATSLVSCGGNKEVDVEKEVRFEVDMALALSATGFKWSRALKHKLEQRMNSNQLPTGQMLDHLPSPLPVPRPLVPTEATRPKGIWQRRSYCRKTKEENEFRYLMRILRGLLPGGNEMDSCELLSEVESCVVCLQLQVNVLKSLVEGL